MGPARTGWVARRSSAAAYERRPGTTARGSGRAVEARLRRCAARFESGAQRVTSPRGVRYQTGGGHPDWGTSFRRPAVTKPAHAAYVWPSVYRARRHAGAHKRVVETARDSRKVLGVQGMSIFCVNLKCARKRAAPVRTNVSFGAGTAPGVGVRSGARRANLGVRFAQPQPRDVGWASATIPRCPAPRISVRCRRPVQDVRRQSRAYSCVESPGHGGASNRSGRI